MASGTLDRPLGAPADEKALLGLAGLEMSGGVLRVLQTGIDANATRYFLFPSGTARYGLLCIDGTQAAKQGFYLYGGGSGSSTHLTTVVSPSQSGVSVSVQTYDSSRVCIKITNGANYMYVLFAAYVGTTPTVTSTPPT